MTVQKAAATSCLIAALVSVGFADDAAKPDAKATSAIIAETATISVHQRQVLDADIERAIQLIDNKNIETLIDDYFPIGDLQRLRSQKQSLADMAKTLQRRPEMLVFLKEQLELARKGVWDGNADEVTAYLNAETSDTEQPASLPAVNATPHVGIAKGYGMEFPVVLKTAVAELKAKKYETFLVAMLPLSEVARLDQSSQLDVTAAIFETHPEMAAAMISDLEAIAKLNPQPKGSLVSVPLPSPISGESPREIRFQLVAGNWRFFDQTSEVQKTLVPILKSEPKVAVSNTGAGAALEFERIRDHWRIKRLPNPPIRR